MRLLPPGGVLLLIAVAASLRNPLPRWLLGLIIAPLGLIWAAAFSYDLRNLALIVPFVGALAGIGSVTMWGRVRAFGPLTLRERGRAINFLVPRETVRVEVNRNTSKKPGIRSLRLGHVIGSVALLAIAVGLCIPDHAFLGVQRRQQRTVGIAELNRRLYDYAAAHPQTTIASDYLAMPWLPELGHQSVTCTCHDMASFRQTFDRPEVCCVLIRTAGAVPTVRAYLKTLPSRGGSSRTTASPSMKNQPCKPHRDRRQTEPCERPALLSHVFPQQTSHFDQRVG